MLLVDYNLRLDAEGFRTIADDEQSISGKIEVAPTQPADFQWLQRLAEQQHDYSLVANGSASFAASGNQSVNFIKVKKFTLTAGCVGEFAWGRLRHLKSLGK